MNEVFHYLIAVAIGVVLGIQLCILMAKFFVFHQIDSLVDLASKKLLNKIKAAVLMNEMEADDE